MNWLRRSCVASMTTVWSTSCARPRRSCSTCASSRPQASWRTTVVCVRSARTSPGSIQRCTSERSASVERRRVSDHMSEKQQEKSTVANAEERHYRKTRQGYVVSDKMDKTVIVEVEDRVKHALYGLSLIHISEPTRP